MTGAMKEMFDRAYYPLLGQVAGRAYATAIAAGSDGHGAQAQIDRIATGWRLRRVAEPLIICLAAQTPQAILAPKAVAEESLARCRELGTALAAGIALGMF
jgi:multimeric flavodoxin WrbA